MKIIEFNKVDMASEFGIETECDVYRAHVLIKDIGAKANEMISIVSDTSWIQELDAVDQISFAARAEKTINKLVNDIFSKIDEKVTVEFGEYLVSCTAQEALELEADHKLVPLADIFKERVTGNGGFDFHSEATTKMISFGEAKYSGRENRWSDALEQINDMIAEKKDDKELRDLRVFVSESALKNYKKGQKGYVAAFSINAKKPKTIFNNAAKSEHFMALLDFPELYLIGVEVDDK